MIRTALAGLRGRLLLSLVATSAVTLVVAAAITLSPLQSQLREQAVATTRNAAEDLRSDFVKALKTRPSKHPTAQELRDARWGALFTPAFDLRRRTGGARVLVADREFTDRFGDAPAFIYDTDGGVDNAAALVMSYHAIAGDASEETVEDNQLSLSLPLVSDNKVIGALIVERDLTEVSSTVALIRNAFFTAAAIGLAVAIGLGLALSGTLTRRLKRLQRAALRITAEGPEAPPPIDRGRDEVGDLARAINRMQNELRRQETARRSFVSTASHELRTPLTMLSGTMELLDEDLQGGVDLEDAREQVAMARVELRRLSTLASELLDLSRLDAAVVLRSEPVELGEIARAVVAEFALHASDRGTALEIASPGPCWGQGDPAACARVVRILIDNALRYAPAGEPILISTDRRGDVVIVRVADHGLGVPAEEQEHIFERFHRGKATSEVSGFGLGLAIGRELAVRMNGTLSLEDSERGAQFALTLPASPNPSSRTPSPGPGSGGAA